MRVGHSFLRRFMKFPFAIGNSFSSVSPLRSFVMTELGQDVIEYALLCALIALSAVSLAVSFQLNIENAYSTINSKNTHAHGNAFGKGHGSGNPGRGNPGGNGNGNGNP